MRKQQKDGPFPCHFRMPFGPFVLSLGRLFHPLPTVVSLGFPSLHARPGFARRGGREEIVKGRE